MRCERCSKETWLSHTIRIPTNGTSVGWYKVCPECYAQWEDKLRQTFHQYMKEGDENDGTR